MRGTLTIPFADTAFGIFDTDDPTKLLKFDVGNISIGTTRTITMADRDLDLDNPLFTNVTADKFIASNGLVGSPSHTFTNSTATGMFAQTGAGTVLNFAVAGNQYLALSNITGEAVFSTKIRVNGNIAGINDSEISGHNIVLKDNTIGPHIMLKLVNTFNSPTDQRCDFFVDSMGNFAFDVPSGSIFFDPKDSGLVQIGFNTVGTLRVKTDGVGDLGGASANRWRNLNMLGNITIGADNKGLLIGVTNTDIQITSDGTNGIISTNAALEFQTDLTQERSSTGTRPFLRYSLMAA